ncbi:unnamed protein product [Pedinophyceae sp. YPF-701]|nr:unnamed protein product [Pedinophyceae sp. YPF-701]
MSFFGNIASKAGGFAGGLANRALNYGPREDDHNRLTEALAASDGAADPEARAAAVGSLAALLARNPGLHARFAEEGVPLMLTILHQEHDDPKLPRAALSALRAAMPASSAPHPPSNHSHSADAAPPGEGEAVVGGLPSTPGGGDVATRLLSDPAAIQALFSTIENPPVGTSDPGALAAALEVLTCMLAAQPEAARGHFTNAPPSLVRVVAIATSPAIANGGAQPQAAACLARATEGAPQLQSAAAHEGCLELPLAGIEGSGGLFANPNASSLAMGALRSLLNVCPDAQGILHTSGGLSRLMALIAGAVELALPGPQGLGKPSSKQAAALCAALEALEAALSVWEGGESVVATSQAALAQTGAFVPLMRAAAEAGGVASSSVRAAALRCVALALYYNAEARASFEVLQISVPGPNRAPLPVPALQACLRAALWGESPGECRAGEAVLELYCLANPEGQEQLAHSLHKSTGFGAELVRALVGRSDDGNEAIRLAGRALRASAAAASALAVVVSSCGPAATAALSYSLRSPNLPPEWDTLIPRVVQHTLSSALAAGHDGAPSAARSLRLLISWCRACPAARAALLSYPDHLPFLVDAFLASCNIDAPPGKQGPRAFHAGDGPVPGLIAVLLATLASPTLPGSDPSDSGALERGVGGTAAPSPADVLSAICTRAGLPALLSAMRALDADPAVEEALNGGPAGAVESGGGGFLSSLLRVGRGPAALTELGSAIGWAFCYELRDAREAGMAALSEMYAAGGARDAPDAAQPPRGITGGRVGVEDPEQLDVVRDLRAEVARLQAQLAAEQEAAAAARGDAEALRGTIARKEREIEALNAHALTVAEQDGLAAKKSHEDVDAANAEAASARTRAAAAEKRAQELEVRASEADARAAAAEDRAAQAEARAAQAEERAGDAEAAQQEVEASMEDLLACLGQEEARAETLAERLRELGEDPDALTAHLMEEDDGGGGE